MIHFDPISVLVLIILLIGLAVLAGGGKRR